MKKLLTDCNSKVLKSYIIWQNLSADYDYQRGKPLSFLNNKLEKFKIKKKIAKTKFVKNKALLIISFCYQINIRYTLYR